jgi:endonuclease/exonuclease/phosphatase family metal-dependent hydrolase
MSSDAPWRVVFRVMTYNVHRCIGTDGRLSPHRIAEVIGRCRPDIVALQELDVGRARTDRLHQAGAIARQLGMNFVYAPAYRIEGEEYGDAILTSLPMRVVRAETLPGLQRLPRLEPRGAIWVTIDLGGTKLQVINTHLGLLGRERLAQVETLLGERWIGNQSCVEPVLLVGDFNLLPWSAAYRRLRKHLRDAQLCRAAFPRPTFPAKAPMLRIDHVFVSERVEVYRIEVPRTALTRIASDHLPLIVDFRISGG